MGSVIRGDRCDLFLKTVAPVLEKKLGRYDFQKGDWFELVKFELCQSEDGTECVKLYVTLRNKRTGDEHQFTEDTCMFEPVGMDHDNVSKLAASLCDDHDQETYEKNVKKAVRLLKKAGLINPKYSAEEEVP